jgi:hypothetical protein
MMQRTYIEAGFAAGYHVVDCVQVAGRGWQYILMPEVQ